MLEPAVGYRAARVEEELLGKLDESLDTEGITQFWSFFDEQLLPHLFRDGGWVGPAGRLVGGVELSQRAVAMRPCRFHSSLARQARSLETIAQNVSCRVPEFAPFAMAQGFFGGAEADETRAADFGLRRHAIGATR